METLRHVLRHVGRAPAFTALALITVAVGIGANTAIFSVVNGVLIKPLPYSNADELVGVWHTAPGVGLEQAQISPSMFFTYRDENRTFRDFGVWASGSVTVTGVAEPEQVRTVWVTDGVLQALAVPLALGRSFSREDDTPGSPNTVMLTHGYWRRRFGGDPSVVGRPLTVDARPHTVIGVMPAGFSFLSLTTAEVFLPHRFDRARTHLGNFSYQGMARLKPGATLEQANADVARMLPIWLNAWPAPLGGDRRLFENARIAPAMQPLKQDVVGDVGDVLWVLMGTIGVVLLIACANVANLLLVRVEARQQELTTRAALGADWWRIARGLLQESLLLALIGGVLGLLLAYTALELLVAIGPDSLPRLHEITIDVRVLGFTALAALLSGLLFGVIPVLKYSGPRVANALRATRTSSHSRERHRARNVLVVVQVALALVLLIASGLMVRTVLTLRRVQPGFTRPAQLQMVRVSVPDSMIREPERVARLHNEILEKLAAIPDVEAAAFASSAPLEGFNSNDPVLAEDKVYEAGRLPPLRRSNSSRQGSSERSGRRSSVGEISRGPTCSTTIRLPWCPRTWRVNCGAARRPHWESAFASRRGTRGVRSSASWATFTTTAFTSQLRRSCTGP